MMNTTAEIKNHIHRLVVETDDATILNQIIDYFKRLKTKDTDWYDELTVEQKEDIEIGLKELDEGKVVSNREVQKNVNKLLGEI